MKYHELSDKAKEKARDSTRERLEFWSEPVIEDWTVLLEKLGFYKVEILWSGFWSQGDGACFEGYWGVNHMKLDEVSGYTSEARAKEILAIDGAGLEVDRMFEDKTWRASISVPKNYGFSYDGNYKPGCRFTGYGVTRQLAIAEVWQKYQNFAATEAGQRAITNANGQMMFRI